MPTTCRGRSGRVIPALVFAPLIAFFWLVETPAGSALPVVACSAERPTVALGDAVVVRAWVSAEPDQVRRYAWDMRIGRVLGDGPEVRWDLSAVQSGQYAAAVRAHYRNGIVSEECLLRVVVRRDAEGRGPVGPTTAPAPPGSVSPSGRWRETGGAFLLSTQPEASGYGLYSYLLFGSPPSDGGRDRYLKALDAYVGLIPDMASLEQYVAPLELNIAYVPLKTPPERQVAADSLLARYDYARARSILRLFPVTTREGPYIVSTLRPLGGPPAADASPTPYLFQDLSKVPPHLVATWVKEFLNQAAQERFWENRSAERLALKLRVTVGVLATALPEVQKALDTWIAWVR